MQVSTGGSLYRKLAAAVLCRMFRMPYIVHVHAGGFEGSIRRSRVASLAARRLVADAAVTIVVAERWRRFFEQLGAMRVLALPNGLSASERIALESVRRRPQPASLRPVLLFYGRWTPAKGIDRVADALRALGGDEYEVRLFGSGDRDWLERSFANLEGTIHVGGWIDLEAKVAELERATVLLVPSRVEAFGQVMLDARAAGAAVIASDCGAVGEVLAGHEPVLLSDCDDDAGLRADLARVLDGSWPPDDRLESPALPERYTAEYGVAALTRIYREVARCPVARRSRRRG